MIAELSLFEDSEWLRLGICYLIHVKELLNSPVRKISNVIRGYIKSWAPRSMRSACWDREYNTGAWSHVKETDWPELYEAMARLSRCGRLLDLGCGWGLTGMEIPKENCRSYLGVDISAVAVGAARKRSSELGLDRNRYEVGDILSFEPKQRVDCILFRESIYYLTDVLSALQRYSRYLEPSGIFVVTLYDRSRHAGTIRLISDNFDVIQKADGHDDGIALLFRPRL